MNFFKRAVTSVSRRKGRSLILLLIILILGNVMLSTILIVQSVDETKSSIIKELPPIVSLELDYEKLQELYDEQYGPVDFELQWITYEDLDRVGAAAASYIKSYDYSTNHYIETDSIKPYTIDEDDMGYSRSPFGDDIHHFMIQGVGIPNFLLLEVGEAEIIEGRTFTEEEVEGGRPVLILSKELADANNFRVGDMVYIESQFSDYSESGERITIETIPLELELIGILQYREIPKTGSERDEYHDWYMEMEKKNTILTNNRFVAEFTEKSLQILRPHYEEMYGEDIYGDYDYNPLSGVPITYVLHSSEDVGSFVNIAESTLDNEYHIFRTQEDNFKRVAGPLESMQNILTYAFYITLGSSVVVLALILFGFMRDRQKEIGIYLALGEKKSKIIGQMIVESVAIGLLGSLLSLGSGLFVATYISDILLHRAGPDQFVDMYSFHLGGSYLANINYDSIIQGYQLGFSPAVIVLFMASITGTIIAAQLIASLYVVKFDPKRILM